MALKDFNIGSIVHANGDWIPVDEKWATILKEWVVKYMDKQTDVNVDTVLAIQGDKAFKIVFKKPLGDLLSVELHSQGPVYVLEYVLALPAGKTHEPIAHAVTNRVMGIPVDFKFFVIRDGRLVVDDKDAWIHHLNQIAPKRDQPKQDTIKFFTRTGESIMKGTVSSTGIDVPITITPGTDGRMFMKVSAFITLNVKKKQVDYNMATSFRAVHQFGTAFLRFFG